MDTYQDHPPSVAQKRGLSTLNWLLILALAMALNYLVLFWTMSFGADEDAVSHVGFAGTIVSIVLGVVAIVYAFYQTFSQQRDGDALRAQLHRLNRISAKLAQREDGLKGVEQQLGAMVEASQRTAGAVESVRERLDAQSRQKEAASEPPESANSARASDADLGRRAEVVISKANDAYQAIYIAIVYAASLKWSPTEVGAFVADVYHEYRADAATRARSSFMTDWLKGLVSASVYFLDSLELIQRHNARRTDNGEEWFTLTAVFEARVSQISNESTNSSALRPATMRAFIASHMAKSKDSDDKPSTKLLTEAEDEPSVDGD